MDGGERVEGTWRTVFIHNGDTFYLTELKIYEDGLVDCWGLVDLAEFRQKVASGWVATELPAGARVSAHLLASWTATEPTNHLSGDELVREVVDEVDRLAGRPTAAGRCMAALERFLETPSEEGRAAVRAAYGEIPRHLRRFVLGDMDAKDLPLRTLMTPAGTVADGRTVTAADHERATAYFAERRPRADKAAAATRTTRTPRRTTTLVPQTSYPNGWPAELGATALRPEFPRPIRYRGRTYPSAHHAFWSAALEDRGRRSDVLSAPTPFAVEKAARAAGLRPDWPDRQLAVMTDLLRHRFGKEKDLAQLLRSTGSSQILYQAFDDHVWGCADGGENWMGRLLELVRSELADEAAGGVGPRRWRR
ncbi:hypothetical protein Cch01nite_21010 [Cellulomonas chitinilytica]|uniref:Riboflavin biosynthesis intermediates N-glycosidase n=2 Tax=Cellulomonas chitinilytica TaxID=398759 RepID=A0A919P3B9_9CELL|nr:hypothetical protein Cch01nite_21010 [Cellulomonas chitinilytica]